MNRNIILSESEKNRILWMHKKAIKNEFLTESLSAPEPISTGGIGFKVYFEEDESDLPAEGKTLVVSTLKKLLKSSMPTIEEFYDNKEFPIPKFIKVGAATSSTGSREYNANKGQERIDTMVDCIYDAFDELGKETGNVVGSEYIKKFLTTNTDTTYEPTKLKKLYDADKSAPKAKERYAYVEISPLITQGREWKEISGMADEIQAAVDSVFGRYMNVDEDGVADAICMCETYSDIEDLNVELKSYGGLQYVINRAITDGLTSMGSDTKERIRIKDCLNAAAKSSGKGEIADISGGRLTIIGM